MFVASYRNTMASAKPKFRGSEDRPKVVSMAELRERREAERRRYEQERKDAAEAAIREQKRIADEAIRRANRVLARYRQKHSFEAILSRVCGALKIHPTEIFSDSRGATVVFARQAVMYWACRLTGRSLSEIGGIMGRDHTSVGWGLRSYVQKRASQGRYLRDIRGWGSLNERVAATTASRAANERKQP